MVKGAFAKTVIRTYAHSKGRFLANFLTVLFSVGITGGLGAIPNTFTPSFTVNYTEGRAPDFTIKGKSHTGISKEEVETILSYEETEEAEPYLMMDAVEQDGTCNRFYVLDLQNGKIAHPVLLDGRYPSTRNEVVMEKPNHNRKDYAIGTTMHFEGISRLAPGDTTITGIVDSPLYNCAGKERAMLEDPNDVRYVDAIFYVERSTLLPMLQTLYTDVNVRLKINHEYLTDEYRSEVNAIKKKYETRLGADDFAILTLEENTSYALFRNYNDKIRTISFIFPFFFIAVCALISHITIVRMIKDDRPSLACCVSAGVAKRRIVMKYMLFITASIFLGGVAGYLLGTPLLPLVIIPAYQAVFQIGPVSVGFVAPIALIIFGLLILAGIAMSVFSALSYLKEQPSDLMHDKAPSPGKKILMERIPFIWKPLSFSLKSSFRNIFRQKKNFFLTSFAIIGAVLLILLGFSLLNVSDAMKEDELFSDVASSMGLISTVIVLLAIGMTVPILYALANMNIEDRKREIATLKVLGYHDIQCLNYTFREILITSIIAVIVGLPVSALITDAALRFIGFGSVKDVLWWSYVLDATIVLATTVGINYMLFPRIRKIDMNSSLKAVE